MLSLHAGVTLVLSVGLNEAGAVRRMIRPGVAVFAERRALTRDSRDWDVEKEDLGMRRDEIAKFEPTDW